MGSSPSRAPSLAWPLLLMGVLLFASHWQVAPMLPDVSWVAPDKVPHFFLFGLLASLWQRRFRVSLGPWPAVFLGWAVASTFGFVDELVQAGNPARFFDPVDLLADTLGALVAVLAYELWPAYRALLERPLLRRPGACAPSPRRYPHRDVRV